MTAKKNIPLGKYQGNTYKDEREYDSVYALPKDFREKIEVHRSTKHMHLSYYVGQIHAYVHFA